MKRNGLEQPQASPLVVPTAISGNTGGDAQWHVAPMGLLQPWDSFSLGLLQPWKHGSS